MSLVSAVTAGKMSVYDASTAMAKKGIFSSLAGWYKHAYMHGPKNERTLQPVWHVAMMTMGMGFYFGQSIHIESHKRHHMEHEYHESHGTAGEAKPTLEQSTANLAKELKELKEIIKG